MLPWHLVADEKHTRINGEKAFVATTVAKECIPGAQLSMIAGTKKLIMGYLPFKEEACNLDPDYQPKTVNTDGREPTRSA